MAETDRITETAKRAMIVILNQAIQIEYAFIINYPRLIDQVVAIEEVPDQQIVADMERLGKDSTEHLGSVGQLITHLGGEPLWRVNVIGRMIDLDKLFAQQLQREKAAQTMYRKAKRIAQDNPVRSTALMERLRTTFSAEPDPTPRAETIRLLEHLASEEETHARLVEDILGTYRAMPKRHD